jgi:hypothetical protein
VSNDGSKAQDLIQDALKYLERYHKCTWVRLYDSHSAGFGNGGNIIPPQPGDFILVGQDTSALLEVKSSEKNGSLINCNIRNTFREEQILGARLWMAAGNRAVVPFYSVKLNRFELWHSGYVVDAYLAPPRHRKLKGEPFYQGGPGADMALALKGHLSYTV